MSVMMSVMADQALFAYFTLFQIKLSIYFSEQADLNPFLQQFSLFS